MKHSIIFILASCLLLAESSHKAGCLPMWIKWRISRKDVVRWKFTERRCDFFAIGSSVQSFAKRHWRFSSQGCFIFDIVFDSFLWTCNYLLRSTLHVNVTTKAHWSTVRFYFVRITHPSLRYWIWLVLQKRSAYEFCT